MKFVLLILKNVARNPVRTVITALGTMVLVWLVTMVWSILTFLDQVTAEKAKNLKAIVTERWRMPSMMPFSYASTLKEAAARKPGDARPDDYMTWQFYGGTTDPTKNARENVLFAVATDPAKVLTMFDELEDMSPAQIPELTAAVKRMQVDRRGILIGYDRLEAIHRRIGDRIKLYSVNYKGIDLEFEIMGTFPRGRYDNTCVMNCQYLNDALDAYAQAQPGHKKHPLADRSLNLVWLRVSDRETFGRVAQQITTSPFYGNPAVKCETASSLVTAALEAFRDIIWGVRWLLSPAAMVAVSLIIANAISIGVRERRTELAVLKVLGFRPMQILVLVLAEAMAIGTLAGFSSGALTYLIINHVMGGIKFPIGFFGSFYIPIQALWWGLAMGAGTSFLGSALPAWNARNVKVAEVFSKVA